jgi:hypothetical protein
MANDEYPLRGVRLSSLQSFIVTTCAELGLDHGTLTTANFCAKVVLPQTLEKRSALLSEFNENDVKEIATIFVSHAVSPDQGALYPIVGSNATV